MLAGLVAGCASQGVLSPRGPIADANRSIMLNSLAVMLAIVVPTLFAACAIAWWFRAGNARARYQPQFVYSGRIEAIVWGVPLLTIVFLSGLIWTGSHQLDPYRPIDSRQPPLEVQVVSLDWKWLFIYPQQGVASVNRLVMPVGRPVHFTLTSASVMNAFFVPQLGSQIYTMNGMATQLHLQADHAGTYRGQSSQFSGDGFSAMTFAVEAVPAEAFGRWTDDLRQHGDHLDAAAYARLTRQTRGCPTITFSSVEPHLFETIVRQQTPPARSVPQGLGVAPEVSPQAGR
ncbi:MAG TPA: ubiquinol oxidase subunit II [Caulobacter sp.]|nr:ubiquinol oxidase subunit II [Caulobacter sp.]